MPVLPMPTGQTFCSSRLENLGESWQEDGGARVQVYLKVYLNGLWVYLGCQGHVDHVSVHVGIPQERIRAEIVRLIILELNVK